MRTVSTLTCLLLSAFLFFSCKSKDKGPAYSIKMRLANGDKFGNDMDMKMDIGVKMAGMKMDMRMTMLIGTDTEVMGDTAGMKKLKFTYPKYEMDMEVTGLPDPDDKSREEMKEAAKNIEGKSIYVLLDKQNKITEVIGFKELMGNIEEDDIQARRQMEEFFSKEQINNTVGLMFQLYPDDSVRIGDSWEKETDMSVGPFKMKTKNKYKLEKVMDGLAVIAVETTFKAKGEMRQQGMGIEMDMEGTQKGHFNVILENGYVKSGDYKIDMTAEAMIMGQKIPYDIQGTWTMKER